MTKALNLANFANNVDTTGNVDPNALASAVPLTKGGTGATSASAARTSLGLGSLSTLSAVTDTELNTTGVTAGTYGSTSAIPVVTVTNKGRVTSLSTVAVAGGQYLGTADTKAIAYNAQTISENITIGATQNGLSAGPITVATGFTVTISTGGNWVIV
jgi:hypothetical protein